MSVYRSKQSGIVIQGAKLNNSRFTGIIRIPFQIIPGYSITEDDAEQLFTESEVQKKIESAVDEGRKLMKDDIQFWKDLANANKKENNDLLGKISVLEERLHDSLSLSENFKNQANKAILELESSLEFRNGLISQINQLKSESKELQNDALSMWYDEERKLKKRIDELVKQIEELKSKVRQPVELNKAYCDELDRLLENYGPITILHKVIKGDINLGLIHSLDLGYLVQALTDGYTVKPEPTLQDQIETILRALEYDFEGVESAAKEIVIVLKHEGLIKDEES